MAYAGDLKSLAPNRACGFDSHPGHQRFNNLTNVLEDEIESLRGGCYTSCCTSKLSGIQESHETTRYPITDSLNGQT
jgi:hypothetical protein